MSKVDLKRDSEKRLKCKVGRRHKRDSRLQELEKQLEFAESRCGTLKQQLDYIKLLYGCKKVDDMEKECLKEEGRGDGSNVNSFSYVDVTKWNKNGSFETGENGDCPDFMRQTASYTNTISTNCSSKQFLFATNQEKEENKRKGQAKPKSHLKLLKIKKKNVKKIKKRRKGDGASPSKTSNASSQTQSQIWPAPVVEIYKNSALNVESESGLEIICKKKRLIERHDIKRQKIISKNNEKKEEDDKDKTIEEPKTKKCSVEKKTVLKDEGIQTESTLDIQNKKNDEFELLSKENSIKTESLFEPLKGYCQPTISSRRKQVERDIYSNLTNLNVRNIPFIAARSTTPSHNIGVNIQQVLSIIKKRHPFTETISGAEQASAIENPPTSLFSSKKLHVKNEFEHSGESSGAAKTDSSESKKRFESVRSNMSHWRSNYDISRDKSSDQNEKTIENPGQDWSLKVNKLKRVLVFLHEDFTTLSQKYKKLQKKITKRNITKTDAKDELADIERDLEKKEEEITVVIGLYKEVLSLREDFKKLQEKYNSVACGRTFMMDGGLKQSNSTHTQMTTLLRKIQNFQDQLKG